MNLHHSSCHSLEKLIRLQGKLNPFIYSKEDAKAKKIPILLLDFLLIYKIFNDFSINPGEKIEVGNL
jgi:hypothetical protein